MQTNWTLPGVGYYGFLPEQWGWLSINWAYNDPITVPPFDLFVLSTDIYNWVSSWLPTVVFSPRPSGEFGELNIFLNTTTGLKTYLNAFPFLTYSYAPTLPLSQCVVMQTLSTPTFPYMRGRKFLSPLAISDVVGNRLTAAAQSRMQAAVQNAFLPNTLISQGIIFQPLITSWKYDNGFGIDQVRINSRLGMLKRRCRARIRFKPTTFSTPIPVPP
jgi:hypothetical protein